jgi:putative transposase
MDVCESLSHTKWDCKAPKYAVSQVIGSIKGKSTMHLARVYGERTRSVMGQHFWARGYFVSIAGRDE